MVKKSVIYPLIIFVTAFSWSSAQDLGFTFQVGDKLNILREPVHPDHQSMQPSLNPWTVTSGVNSAGYFSITSGNVIGYLRPSWGDNNPENPDPFFDATPVIDDGDTGGGDDDNSTGGGDDGHGGGDDNSTGGGDGGGDDGTGGGDDGGGSDDGGGIDNNSTTGPVDTDDDVPMLTEIYNRLATLDKDSTQYQDYDSNTLNNIWNELQNTRGHIQANGRDLGEQVRLSDIEYNTRQLELNLNGIRGQIFDGNVTRDATLADIVNAINNQNDDTNASFNPGQTGQDYQEEYEQTFTNLSNSAVKNVTLDLGQEPGFMSAPAEFTLNGKQVKFSLLDPASSYGSMYTAKISSILPSRAEIFLFIKRCILVIVFALYYYFNYRLLFATTDTLIKSNESNTVSNYSILGVNIGGPALKAIKLGTWAIFVVGIGFTTMVGLADSGIDFSLDSIGQSMVGSGEGSSDQSIIDIIVSAFVVHIAGIADWAFASVQMFLDIVPISTIVSAVTTYYSNSLLIYGSIFAMNRASRTAS